MHCCGVTCVRWPPQATDNQAYGCRGYPEGLRDVFLENAARGLSTNYPRIVLLELLATERIHPPSPIGVPDVVFVRAETQMIGPHAERRIAIVPHNQPFRDRAVM